MGRLAEELKVPVAKAICTHHLAFTAALNKVTEAPALLQLLARSDAKLRELCVLPRVVLRSFLRVRIAPRLVCSLFVKQHWVPPPPQTETPQKTTHTHTHTHTNKIKHRPGSKRKKQHSKPRA